MSDDGMTSPLREAGRDSEERDTTPPAANPNLDMDDEDNQAPARDDSDNESELSEVDEADFDDFDPTSIALQDKPHAVVIDDEIARSLKASKRKRTDGEGKKPKEGKRDKKKKRRDEDEDPGGEELDGKRIRKPKSVRPDGERRDKVSTPYSS